MSKQSRRKRSMSAADISGDLPINNPDSDIARKESSRTAMAHKLVHLIPVVVILCFFILWWFSYPVEMVTKDGVTSFVPIIKKPKKEGEENDVDLTVLAMKSPPDDFLTLSDAPYPLLALREQPNVSLLETHDQNASLTHSYAPNVPVPRISYPGTSNEAAPHPSGEG